MSDLHSRITAWLIETGDHTAGSRKWVLRIHRGHVDDIVRCCRKTHRDAQVKLAAGVYVDDQDSPDDHVEPAKKRGGLLVVADSDLILARELSWGRTHCGVYELAHFTAEPITFKLKGKDEGPGLRLRHWNGGIFALGLWGDPGRHPKGLLRVRDRMIELASEASSR